MNLKSLSKIELHRHLEGSIRLKTIIELAQKHKINIDPKKLTINGPMTSLKEVLDCFWNSQKVLNNYEAIKRVTFENVEDAFQEGVKLLELRFAPVFIKENKKLEFDEIIEGVIDGITLGMNKYDIQVGLIHIMPRSMNFDENLKATKEIFRYQSSYHKNADRLVGFDLADLETDESFDQYEKIIHEAHEKKFGVTIHSGEDTSPEHVTKTIKHFKASRIGHGIQIAKDPEIIKLVKEHDLALEVCPTSNWLTNCVKKIEEHPLKYLFDQGVKVTLNSDDPHIMNINLVHEYELAVSKLGMSIENLVQMNKWALEKSFLPNEIKKDVKRKFTEFQ